MVFRDRHHAGELLAKQLERFAEEDVIVVGLPRGGMVVAEVVARRLHAPLDFLVVEKLGAPGHAEFAIGAIGPEDQIVLNEELVERMGIPQSYINKVVGQEGVELERKEREFRKVRPEIDLTGRTVILVDDGIATGSTVEVAVKSLRRKNPKKIVLAVPVAPQEAIEKLEKLVDEVFCLVVPTPFMAVGQFYDRFDQTETDEVVAILRGEKAGKD
jgi:putative phosphoribosyl transferase